MLKIEGWAEVVKCHCSHPETTELHAVVPFGFNSCHPDSFHVEGFMRAREICNEHNEQFRGLKPTWKEVFAQRQEKDGP